MDSAVFSHQKSVPGRITHDSIIICITGVHIIVGHVKNYPRDVRLIIPGDRGIDFNRLPGNYLHCRRRRRESKGKKNSEKRNYIHRAAVAVVYSSCNPLCCQVPYAHQEYIKNGNRSV